MGDSALLSDYADKLQRMVCVSHLAFQRWDLLMSGGNTKSMTMDVPRSGDEAPPLPVISIGNQWIEHATKSEYLEFTISPDDVIKGKIIPRIGQAQAAFWSIERGESGMTIPYVDRWCIIRADHHSILLRNMVHLSYLCEELETVQMWRLWHFCGNRSWGRDVTPYEGVGRKCRTPTVQNVITYHGLT